MTVDSEAVEVVGAGPAGLAAAITLARGGRQVILHEAQSEVGHRFRRDLQGLENWSGACNVLDELRDAGLSTDFNMAPCTHGVCFDAWDRPYSLRSSVPIFYTVERGPRQGSLDRTLLDQARSLGVEVRFCSHRENLSRAGIFATGPHAADAIAVGYHFETCLSNGFWVILDDTLAPGGYAYMLVLNGCGTVKSCMFREFAGARAYADRAVNRFRHLIDFDMREVRFHGGVGNFFIPSAARWDRALVAGEQAGFQDALAGFGMRYGMLSGVMAARSLLTESNYDVAWQDQLKRPMEMGRVNRMIYGRLGNRGYRWLLRTQTWAGDSRLFLSRIYLPARMRLLLLPLAGKLLPASFGNPIFGALSDSDITDTVRESTA